MSQQKKQSTKPWGGRFRTTTHQFVERFTASVQFDQRLYQYDIDGSIVHARMLNQAGILTAEETQQIEAGLESIRADIAAERFNWSITLEDVHMNIEAALIERIGETGKKLHTGRSRNDQVATDLRLYARAAIDSLCGLITTLQTALIDLAEREVDTILPGFTHLQTAQPVSFGHHLLAWNEMLERDYQRLLDCRQRVNLCPLGAAALAGTSFAIDRHFTARQLGFAAPANNSLDAVSDRDFAIELAAAVSIMMMHLSRFSEELVLWTSPQFDFVELPDQFCTGSSIMPQKKNPDVPELVRGKTGRVNGHLLSLLTLMKSQPLAYNRDNQEDKESLFDLLDTAEDCLRAYAAMMPAVICKRENMKQAAGRGHATATELADYLVKKGLPFRDAHAVVGKAVGLAIASGKELAELELSRLQAFSQLIEADVFDVLTIQGAMAARDHFGGTAPCQVTRAIAAAQQKLATRTAASGNSDKSPVA